MFLFCFFAFRLNTIESKMEWLSFRFFTNPLWQAEALQQNDNDIGRSVEFIPCRILTPRHHVVVSMTTTTPAPLSRMQTSKQIYNKQMGKNVYPVYSTGIRTHNPQNMSLFL